MFPQRPRPCLPNVHSPESFVCARVTQSKSDITQAIYMYTRAFLYRIPLCDFISVSAYISSATSALSDAVTFTVGLGDFLTSLPRFCPMLDSVICTFNEALREIIGNFANLAEFWTKPILCFNYQKLWETVWVVFILIELLNLGVSVFILFDC